MGWSNPDPYYQPEKFDLVPVAEIDYSDGNYCFDIRVVWKHEPSGKFYTARDAGCSCPSPFEEYHKLDDLEIVDLGSLRSEVDEEQRRGSSVDGKLAYSDFLTKVTNAVKAR